MLLEQLVEKAAQPPEYDWDSYYRWLFSGLAGRDVADSNFWLCKKCLSVNIVYLPARYGKCRSCGLIHLPDDMREAKRKNAVKLNINLFAGLKCENPQLPCCGEREFELQVPDGTTIRELRSILAINPAIPLLTMVNNHHENEEWVLKENDRVGIFPPIGGG